MSEILFSKTYDRFRYAKRSYYLKSYKAGTLNHSASSVPSKGKYFESVLESAEFFFTFKKKTPTADSWLRYCLQSKLDMAKANHNIHQLSRNESKYFCKIFPRGFQKAMAIGFIMEKRHEAFDKDGRFNLKLFKESIKTSTLKPQEKTEVLANLEDKYFKHITYTGHTDTSWPEVRFGNTEYENILILKSCCGNDHQNIHMLNTRLENINSFYAKFIEKAPDTTKILQDIQFNFNHQGITLSSRGLIEDNTQNVLMSLKKFAMNAQLERLGSWRLKVGKISVKEFFSNLKLYFNNCKAPDSKSPDELDLDKKYQILQLIRYITKFDESNHFIFNVHKFAKKDILKFLNVFFDVSRLRKEIIELYELLHKSSPDNALLENDHYDALEQIFADKLFIIIEIDSMKKSV